MNNKEIRDNVVTILTNHLLATDKLMFLPDDLVNDITEGLIKANSTNYITQANYGKYEEERVTETIYVGNDMHTAYNFSPTDKFENDESVYSSDCVSMVVEEWQNGVLLKRAVKERNGEWVTEFEKLAIVRKEVEDAEKALKVAQEKLTKLIQGKNYLKFSVLEQNNGND